MPLNDDINVKISADTSSLNRGLQSINQQMKLTTAEFNNAKAKTDLFGSSLDKLRVESDRLNTALGLQREKVNLLKTAYEQELEKGKLSAEAMRKLAEQYQNAEAKMNRLQKELNDTNRSIAIQGSSWTQLGTKLSQASEKFDKVGSKMSSIGGALSKTVTAPIAGLAGMSIKMATDFESSFAKVSTLLDSNKVNFNEYKSNLLKASSESGIAIKDFSESVYQSISAGVDQTKAIGFTTQAMSLAKGGFADATESVDLLTTILNGYNLKAEDTNKISDILINTQNAGKTTVKELAGSMGAVIPIASSVNFNVSELASSYAELTSKGIATSEAGTYVRSMLTELSKSGTTADQAIRQLTGKGFADLKAQGVPTTEILGKLNDYAKQNGKTLKDMFERVEGGSAAMILASNGGKQYNDLLDGMSKSAGATADAVKKIDSTPAEKLRKEFNELKNKGIEMAERLMPSIERVIDFVGKLVDKFTALSPEMQDNILKWGGIAMAVGPVVKVIGSITSVAGGAMKGIGTLATALGKIGAGSGAVSGATATAEAIGGIAEGAAVAEGAVAGASAGAGLVGALATAAEVMSGPVGWGIGLVTAGVAGIATVMTDTHTQVQLFGDGVSESTKKVLGSYMEMDKGVSDTLGNMKYNNTEVTDEIYNQVTSKFHDMSTYVVDNIKQQNQQYTDEMKSFFDNNVGMNKESEDKILSDIQNHNSQEATFMQQHQDRIKEILSQAKEQHRQLTSDEMTEINNIQSQMRNEAVQTLSASEQEKNLIMEKMGQYQKDITEQQASDLIKQAINKKNEIVKTEQEKYDKVVNEAYRMREAGAINQQEYDKIAQSAKDTKRNNITQAEDMVQGVADKIMEKNPAVLNNINSQTGQVVDAWKVAIRKVVGAWDGFQLSTKYANIDVTMSSVAGHQAGGGGGKLYGMSLPAPPEDGNLTPVNWNAEGAIFTRPTVFGNQGVGEAGAEAVLPLDSLWKQLNSNFDRLSNNITNRQTVVNLVLDGKLIGRAIASTVDQENSFRYV